MTAEKPVPCPVCEIHGCALSPDSCVACNGTGERQVDDDETGFFWETCAVCGGSGDDMVCDLCLDEEIFGCEG